MYHAKFDTRQLISSYPPIGWNYQQSNKELVWKMIQQRDQENKTPSANNDKQRQMRFSKYNSSTLVMDTTNLVKPEKLTKFTIVRGVYGYEIPKDPAQCEWVR